MEITEQTNTPRLETTTQSIKLYKNSKGYNWEIKILSLDIDHIEKLNNEMIARFEDAYKETKQDEEN
jgi:hypothetical protein